MAMLNVTDLRNGKCFEENGVPFVVISYSHIKVARGGATIKLKVKNLIDGSIFEKSYNNGGKVNEAEVSRRNETYLYDDGTNAVFMNPESFEQTEIPLSMLGEAKDYLTDGSTVIVMYYEGRPIGVDLPPHVVLKVTYAENAVKGDTTSSAGKIVEMETGLKVEVPMFIKMGDMIKVDTREGTYVQRV